MLSNAQNMNEAGQHPLNQQITQVKPTPQVKKNAITDDYKVTNQVLGMGINGKVLEIFRKSNGEKSALKVIFISVFSTHRGRSCHVRRPRVHTGVGESVL